MLGGSGPVERIWTVLVCRIGLRFWRLGVEARCMYKYTYIYIYIYMQPPPKDLPF